MGSTCDPCKKKLKNLDGLVLKPPSTTPNLLALTMSSFFTAPSSQKKRKRPDASEPPSKRFAASKTKPPPRKSQRDEEISSDEESDTGLEVTFDDAEDGAHSESEDGEGETAAEKRLRLAERYIESIKQEVYEVRVLADTLLRLPLTVLCWLIFNLGWIRRRRY
jgi:hypothetical protein